MAYNPTTWIDGRTPVNAMNLNKNERGIEQQGLDVEVLSEYVDQMDGRITNDVNVLSEYVNSMDTRVTEDIKSISDFVADLDTKIDEIGDVDSVEVSYSSSTDSSIASVKDALDKLLYIGLSISLNSNVATVLEKGFVVENIDFEWSYNKEIVSQTFDGIVLDNLARSYKYTVPFNDNKTFILTANDGGANFSKSISYDFIYPIYVGSLSSDTTMPTQNEIKSMEKRIVSPSSQAITYNIDNKRMCIAVPSNWTINDIRDANNFNITSSFVVSNLKIIGMDGTEQDYKIYMSEPTSQNNFIVKFNI